MELPVIPVLLLLLLPPLLLLLLLLLDCLKYDSRSKHVLTVWHMALYKYQGYGTGQGWTMKPGNLEGHI